MKKIVTIILSLTLTLGLFSFNSYAAPEWPSGISIEAEGGIVINADTGTVLYGKNMHNAYFPASITKILTALIVIENCDLDETVTFSHNAVFNVESGSSSAGMDVGDTLSVRDCLYALLLKSANEVANALAEHVAGSIEEFSVMMNNRAAELGCTESNFMNPSGLNNPEHYVSAYDMALISRAAFQNEIFVEIDSTTYYKLPQTKRNLEGLPMSTHHQMLMKNRAVYYPGTIGGKTGYTTLAGNTLVTCAKKDGMTLITVVLNGHQTHYSDTKALLDFGFSNFKALNISEYDTTYSGVEEDLNISSLSPGIPAALSMDSDSIIVLPQEAEFTDTASELTYSLDSSDPDDAVAKVNYFYNDTNVGHSYLRITPEAAAIASKATSSTAGSITHEPSASGILESTGEEIETTAPETETPAPETSAPAPEKINFRIPWIVCLLLAVAVIASAIVTFRKHQTKKEEEARILRKMNREQRLKESGFSTEDFDSLLEKRQSSYLSRRGRRRFFRRR